MLFSPLVLSAIKKKKKKKRKVFKKFFLKNLQFKTIKKKKKKKKGKAFNQFYLGSSHFIEHTISNVGNNGSVNNPQTDKSNKKFGDFIRYIKTNLQICKYL